MSDERTEGKKNDMQLLFRHVEKPPFRLTVHFDKSHNKPTEQVLPFTLIVSYSLYYVPIYILFMIFSFAVVEFYTFHKKKKHSDIYCAMKNEKKRAKLNEQYNS